MSIDLTEHKHCWCQHTNVAANWNSPNNFQEQCCWCGQWRPEDHSFSTVMSTSWGQKHGPFKTYFCGDPSHHKPPMDYPTKVMINDLQIKYAFTYPIRDLYIEVGGELVWWPDNSGYLNFDDKGGEPELKEQDPYWPHNHSQEIYNWFAAIHNAWPTIEKMLLEQMEKK